MEESGTFSLWLMLIWMELCQQQLSYKFLILTQIEVSKIDFIEVVN